MIIKYTFNDNDFTQIIERYLDDFGPLSFNYESRENLDKFKSLISVYNDYNDKYADKEDISKEAFQSIKNEIIKLLYENFTTYINNISLDSNWHTDGGFDAEHIQEDKAYIIENIKISLARNIPDQWENGEVVYFVVSDQKYITM